MKIGQVYERMSEANMDFRNFRRGHADGKSQYQNAIGGNYSSRFIADIQRGIYLMKGVAHGLPKKGEPITPEARGRLCGYAMGMLEDAEQCGSYAGAKAALDLLDRTGNLTTSNKVGKLVSELAEAYKPYPETFDEFRRHIGILIGAGKE
ncbi:MAG: hypothetical protein HYW27_04585 [Candidatus Aenigmarchaeota archaeon]|nr:hypothetical protein [Candidatus Aenigmarchaeota archaeon]